VAFVAERQLALVLSPATNGGLPPLLAPRPGSTSGLAGVQLAASALLAEIRQMAAPATTTPVSTNLDNQDVVPMALVAALRSARQLDRSALILASLGLAARQMMHLIDAETSVPWLQRILAAIPPLGDDRPLADDVRLISEILGEESELALGVGLGDDGSDPLPR
jgi:histidine ammonia-lyase